MGCGPCGLWAVLGFGLMLLMRERAGGERGCVWEKMINDGSELFRVQSLEFI